MQIRRSNGSITVFDVQSKDNEKYEARTKRNMEFSIDSVAIALQVGTIEYIKIALVSYLLTPT